MSEVTTGNVYLKHTSLILLALQNVACGLILPHVRKPDAAGNVFFAPTCVVVMELTKMLISWCFVTWKHFDAQRQGNLSEGGAYLPLASDEKVPASSSTSTLTSSEGEYTIDMSEKNHENDSEDDDSVQDEELQSLVVTPTSSSPSTVKGMTEVLRLSFHDVWNVGAFRMAVPSILYVIQNNLQIFSAGYLSPAEFQVFSQMKLITTAVFLVVLLKRKLTLQHWMCILALCVGIVLVKGADELVHALKPNAVSTPGLWAIGFPAILGAAVCSGLACVFLEMQLKVKQRCFWSSNAQLAGFSLLPAMAPVVLDCIRRSSIDPFRYFTPMVWLMIAINVAGGLLVAMVIKYADNILKGFAVSVSLILTILISSYMTGIPLTVFEIIGGTVVAASTFFYGLVKVPPK